MVLYWGLLILCWEKLSKMVSLAFISSSDPFFSHWLDSKFNFSSFQEKYNKFFNWSEVKLRRGRGRSPQISSSLVFSQSVSQVSSVAQLCPTLQPHGLQHSRLPYSSPTPGAYSLILLLLFICFKIWGQLYSWDLERLIHKARELRKNRRMVKLWAMEKFWQVLVSRK